MNKWIKYSLLILLPVGLLLWACFERTAWDEEFTIEDGRQGTARFTYLDWRFWGHPHVISFGGGTISCTGTFRLDGHRSHWESTRDERVFAVQFREQRWYAISYDRTAGHQWLVRFYSGKDGETLQEIAPHDYPLKLAIQNLWLHDETVEAISAFKSDNYWARESLLAKAWWKVLHGEDVKEVEQGFIDKVAKKEFLGRVSFLPPPPRK